MNLMPSLPDVMQQTTSDMAEIRELPPALSADPAGLPVIPGGWTERTWTIGGRVFALIVPAVPDAFLDDPTVIAAHERDEYMPYWAYLWPAAVHMAEAVQRRAWPAETRVLELGAGLALVGLAGLAAGLKVTFSDYDPLAVRLALFNAERLGLSDADGLVLDWRQPSETQFPLMWGCELLYEDRNHELLIDVLQRMLSPGGEAWFGDGGRVRAERFCQLVLAAGMSYELFDEQGERLHELRVGRYQLIVVQR